MEKACIDILTVLLVNRPEWVYMHPMIESDNVLKIRRVAQVLQQRVFGEEHIGRMQPTVTDSHDTHSTKTVAEEELLELCMCHMAGGVLYSTNTLPDIVCEAIGRVVPPQGFKPFLAKYPDQFWIRTHLTDDAAILMFMCINGRRKPRDLGAAALGTVGQGSVKQQLLPNEHPQQQSQTTKMGARDDDSAKALIDVLSDKVSGLRRQQEVHDQAVACLCGASLKMGDMQDKYVYKTQPGTDDEQAPHLLGFSKTTKRGRKRVAPTLSKIREE
jgi:hypothetical protein